MGSQNLFARGLFVSAFRGEFDFRALIDEIIFERCHRSLQNDPPWTVEI